MGWDYFKNKTIETYDNQALSFSQKFSGLLELDRRPEFQRFVDLLPKNASVLDIGAGDGSHALYFQNKGLDVTCIDFSEQMVKICKNKGLNAILMDMEELYFDKKFDGIWAVTSLLHIPKDNIENVLARVHSTLNNDGVFYVSLKEGVGEGFNGERFFSYYSEESFRNVFSKYFEMKDNDFEKVDNNGTAYLQAFLRKRLF